jgi:menaquinone-dependent protoporphyrinogen oxidase
VKFVETHRDAFSQVPVAYFAVCLTLKDDTEENCRTVAAYLKPVDVGLFAGRLDYSKLPFLCWLIAKAMGEAEGDFRDWEAIRAWAGELVPLLGGA